MGLSSGDLAGQGSKLTSVECLSNHSDTIRENGTLYCLVERRRIPWDIADEQTRARSHQSYLGKFDLWWAISHVPQVTFQFMKTVPRWECDLHQLGEYSADKTDPLLRRVFAILLDWHRHWISTHHYRQHFPTFLRSSGNVSAPTLSVAPCDCGQQKYPRGTMASIPKAKK